MDIFAQKKLLVWVVTILVILNLFSLCILIWKDSSRQHEPPLFKPGEFRDVSSILQKELNLSEKQTSQINDLRSSFFGREKSLAVIIRSERDSMNLFMFKKDTDDELVRTLAKEIADNEYKMEILRFDQANQLKAICTSEQIEKFGNLVLEIRDYFRPDNQPKKENDKDDHPVRLNR